MVPPAPDAPRFDLQVDREGAALRLKRAVDVGPARLERLELRVPIDGPLDLRLGPQRLRTRRSEATRVELIIPMNAALGDLLRGAGLVGVRLLDSSGAVPRLLLELEDEVGALALEVELYAEENDLLLVPVDLRWLAEGPFSPWDRAVRALRALVAPNAGEECAPLQLAFDPTVGAFRLHDPVRAALRQVLPAHGWRVPLAPRDALRVQPHARGLRLTWQQGSAAGPRRPASTLEITRGLAAEAPPAAAPEWIRAAHVGAARGLAGRLMDALADRDLGAARRASEALRAEPSRQLQAEGLERLAVALLDRADALLFDEEGDSLESASLDASESGAELGALEHDLGELVDEAGERFLEALALRPRRERSWRRGLALFAAHGPEVTLRVAHAALTSPLPRAVRCVLASEALEAAASDPETRIHETQAAAVDALLAHVLAHGSPARAAAADAIAAALRGDAAQAAEAWERAADRALAEGLGPEIGARFRRRAATFVARVRGPAAAQALLEQALAQGGDEVGGLLELAEVAIAAGAPERAAELYARLLRLETPLDEVFVDALLTAARFHIERGEADRARPFLGAMGPALSPSAPVVAMTARAKPARLEDDERRNALEDRGRSDLADRRSASEEAAAELAEVGLRALPRADAPEQPPVAPEVDPLEQGEENAQGRRDQLPSAPLGDPRPGLRGLRSLPPATIRRRDPESEAPEATGMHRKIDISRARDEQREDVGGRTDEDVPPEVHGGAESSAETPAKFATEEEASSPDDARAREDEGESTPSAVGAPPAPESGPEVDLSFPEREDPSSDISSLIGLPRAQAHSDLPDVTLVGVSDDEVRALLEACEEYSDAGAVMEAALEGAISEGDAHGIRRVLRVLERLGDVRGRRDILTRAESTLATLEDEGEE